MDPLLLRKRKTILRILAGHGVNNVRVFGSRSKGQGRDDSDIDFLVDVLPEDAPWGEIDVKYELEDALGCPVDLIEERNLNRYRRDRILREAIPLEPQGDTPAREDINPVAADMPDDWARLRDILDAARSVERWAAPGRLVFIEDEMRQAAIVRQLEIIGEAVKKLSQERRLEWPGVPWKGIAGQRDVLMHNYNVVDLEKVWERAAVQVPALRRQVEVMLDRMESGREGLPPR